MPLLVSPSTAPVPSTTSITPSRPFHATTSFAVPTATVPVHSTTTPTQPPTYASLSAELGELISFASNLLTTSSSWSQFITRLRPSNQRNDIHPTVRNIPHPAAPLLDSIRRVGVPAPLTSPPWTRLQKQRALQRGPHPSANQHLDFLLEEFIAMIRRGHWCVLPASQVRDLPNLRLSPLGVVPQRERRPRVIVDYTFSNVNHHTVPIAPAESMQFGRALFRLLHHIHKADPRHGPVFLSKLDIADGFYRLWLAPSAIPHLGVLLPTFPGLPQLIAFPLALPMGWANSPPYFCAATETVADLVNRHLTTDSTTFPPHRLEDVASTSPPPATYPEPGTPSDMSTTPLPSAATAPRASPLAYVDVYVDDFIHLAQGSPDRLRHQTRIMLHTLDLVLRPLHPSDPPARQEPASIKKFLKGDGAWTTQKVVLGWLLDTVERTITLPTHRLERLHALLQDLAPTRTRISTKLWHRYLGELRSMSLAIPGASGLFCTLQAAFRHPLEHGRRLRINKTTHSFLADFRWLTSTLPTRPVRLAELLPEDPSCIGACDASGRGMGGIFFTPRPFLWRARFPPSIIDSLLTADTPHGTITNSDLELAGTIVHHDVLCHTIDVRERTVHNCHDNLAAVYWNRKGSTTTTGPAAYLLRLQSLHQRFHRYCHLHDYIPGPANAMADDYGILVDLPPESRDAFCRDFRTVQSAMRASVVSDRASASDRHWQLWSNFCCSINVPPTLDDIQDPIPILQVFACRYRDGRLAPRGLPVRHRTVEDALRSIGQTVACLGSTDPRLNAQGDIDLRLARLLRAYRRADPPPDRVKPIPSSLLHAVTAAAFSTNAPGTTAIADMIIIAFFFLLRPGEYTGNSSGCPFRLMDIQLFIGTLRLDLDSASDCSLQAATHVSYTFTNQKNGVRGEILHHGRSGALLACPVAATIRRVLHLRLHRAPPTTPIATYFHQGRFHPVLASDITDALRTACRPFGSSLGILPSEISARSLRAGGAMALLCANVDADRIQLLGRWRSDAMMRYLHLQAQPVMQGFARKMLAAADYVLHPGPSVPV